MNTQTTLWGREPVLYLGLIQTGLALVAAFWLDLSAGEIGVVMAFAAAALSVLARSQVTPVATLPTGGGDKAEAA